MESEVQATDGSGNDKGGKGKSIKKPKPKMTAVTLVHQDKQAALVQWVVRGTLKRTIVPSASLEGEKVPAADLDAGLPYGDDFTKVKGIDAATAEQMRQRGIWTKEDVLNQPGQAYDAVMVGHVPATIQALLSYARDEEVE